MLKFKDFTNRVVEVYFKDKTSHEVGRLLGLNQKFIFLQNRLAYIEDLKKHVSFGDAWLPLDNIKQISVLEEDDDIIIQFFKESDNELLPKLECNGCKEAIEPESQYIKTVYVNTPRKIITEYPIFHSLSCIIKFMRLENK